MWCLHLGGSSSSWTVWPSQILKSMVIFTPSDSGSHCRRPESSVLIFVIPGLLIRRMSFLQLEIITAVPLSTGHSRHIALEIAHSEGIHGGSLKPHQNLTEWTQVSTVFSKVNIHWETLVSSGSKAYLYRHQCFLLLSTCIKVHNVPWYYKWYAIWSFHETCKLYFSYRVSLFLWNIYNIFVMILRTVSHIFSDLY